MVRARRSDRVLLRRSHKLLVTPLGAEVIGLPPVLLARRGRGRVDLHPAHRIGHRRHHFPLPPSCSWESCQRCPMNETTSYRATPSRSAARHPAERPGLFNGRPWRGRLTAVATFRSWPAALRSLPAGEGRHSSGLGVLVGEPTVAWSRWPARGTPRRRPANRLR